MGSKFTPLLSTNYVPSSDELDEIHTLLTEPINQLTQIDAEMLRLQNAIDQLSLQQTRLHSYITSHKALTAPMRRIPQEILQEIFVHCLPTRHNAVMSDQEPPLLFGRVCGQWRRVSRSTPRLWSSIHLTFMADEPRWSWGDATPFEVATDNDGSFYVEAMNAWLGRAGGLPLSISLFCPSQAYPSGCEERLLSNLIQFSHRWKNLTLIVASTPVPLLPLLSREAVPMLETFSFHNLANPSPAFGIPSLDIYQAPRLHALSSSHLRSIPEGMDWSRLTSLSLESHGPGADELNPSKALSILRSSPNLTFCRLEFGWNSPYHLHDDVVTMPLLKALSINEGTSALNSFFEHLRLPALVNLEFTPSPPRPLIEDDIPSSPSICILLPRLDCLQELTLSANNMFPETLSECLKHTPYITRLSILNNPTLDWHIGWPSPSNSLLMFDDEVVKLLTPLTSINGQSLQMLCPRLKVLECNPCSASDPVLLDFIQQRTIHASFHDVQQLKRVDINFRRRKEIDILAAFPPSVLLGTRISLKYSTYPTPRRHHSPWVGLENRSRLELPTKAYRCLYH